MEEINLLEVFDYFKSKIVWIIACVVVMVVAGNIYTITTRVPMYRSNSTIVLVSEQTSQSDVSMNTNLVSTYSEIIKSRRILAEVIKNLELDCSVSDLASRISLGTTQGTQIITITVSDKEAIEAKNIANELSKVFAEVIQDIYKIDNVTILDTAVIADAPYNLTYAKDNIVYIAVALILSCGIIFVIFYFDTTIKSADVIENKLGLTVLSVVPEERRAK